MFEQCVRREGRLRLATTGTRAGQLDSATYFALDRGMSESEVLARAGPPDLVTHPGGEVIVDRVAEPFVDDDPRLSLLGDYERYREVEIKEFHYIPDHTEHDPHLTIVTLRGGRVWEIERTKLLTRPKAPAGDSRPPASAAARPPSDADIRIERVDRVLSAAEAYSETRARLKAQAAAERERGLPGAPEMPPLHRGVTEDGVPYFGDTPPPGGE